MEEKEVLAAVNLELNRVFKVNYKLPNNPQNYSWRCIECKKPLFYNPNLNCFKHRGQKPEGFEPETLEHKTMKYYWFKTFSLYNPIKTRKLEYWLGDQIADVYFELRENGEKVAIECQNSPISSKKLIERTAKYTAKGIYVLWVFNASGSVVSEEKYNQNTEKVKVLKEEMRVHNLYSGRVYYMNVIGEDVVLPPYALHFTPYFEHKKVEGNIYGCDNYYRKYKNAVYGIIPTYKIICSDYSSYKLARFMDKNISLLSSFLVFIGAGAGSIFGSASIGLANLMIPIGMIVEAGGDIKDMVEVSLKARQAPVPGAIINIHSEVSDGWKARIFRDIEANTEVVTFSDSNIPQPSQELVTEVSEASRTDFDVITAYITDTHRMIQKPGIHFMRDTEFAGVNMSQNNEINERRDLERQEEQEYSTLELIDDLREELQKQPGVLAEMFPERLLHSTGVYLSQFWKDNDGFIRYAVYRARKIKPTHSFKQKDLAFLKEKSLKTFGTGALGLIHIITEYSSERLTIFEFVKEFKNELGKVSGDIKVSKKELSAIFGMSEGYISEITNTIENPSDPDYDPNFKFSIEVLKQLSQNLLVQEYSFRHVLKFIKRYERVNPDLKDYSNQQYTIENPRFFSNIFNIIPSYWFGFMSADMWITKDRYTIGMKLSIKDKEQLDNFADAVGYKKDRIHPRPTFKKYKGEIKRYVAGLIEFVCRPMWQALRELGLFGSKGEIKSVPAYVRYAIEMAKKEVKNLDIHWSQTKYGKIAHAWLLGFYDGDGHHYGGYSAAVFSSSKKLLLDIKDLFESPNPVKTKIEPGTEVMVFDKLTISKGFYRLQLGPDVFRRMLLTYGKSMDRKRP